MAQKKNRKKKDWKELANAFVLGREAAFTIQTLEKAVGSGVSRRSLVRFLAETGSALSIDSEQFVPTWSYFDGSVFLVKPQRWEIEDGILVPGHRFLPFHDLRLFAPDLVLRLDDDTRSASPSVSRRTVAVPLSRAIIFYTLFGQEAMFALIGAENESNAEVDFTDRQNALVRLSAFDLTEFYRRSGFAEGDYLECRLLDWEQGVFSAVHRPAAEIPASIRTDWMSGMERAFGAVFDFFGGPMDIPTQLQYAYFLGDEMLLEEPGGTIGELLAADNDLQFASVGTTFTTIWTSPEVPEQSFAPEEFAHEPEGVTGDLAAILDDIGSSLTAEEVEAFMRDALFHGNRKQDALDRAFAGSAMMFAHDEQAASFHRETDKLWKKVSREYVPAGDTVIGPLRSRLLALYEKQLLWIRSLDARGMDPADLPMGPMRDVGEFFSMITATIELLNYDEGDDRKSLDAITEQLPFLESAGEELLQRAEDAIGEKMKKGR